MKNGTNNVRRSNSNQIGFVELERRTMMSGDGTSETIEQPANPTIEESHYAWDSRGGTHLDIKFDRPVAGLSADELKITNASNGETVTRFTVNTLDRTSYRIDFSGLPNHTVPNGAYSVTVEKEAVVARDGQWNLEENFRFTSLQGDLNRDSHVTIDDLLIVARNYGKTNMSAGDGNADLDERGVVDMNDLLVVTQNLGQSIGFRKGVDACHPPTPFASTPISVRLELDSPKQVL